MNTEAPQLVGRTPPVWTHRFWSYVQSRTGLSIYGVLKIVPYSDVEQWIQGFQNDPEIAAEEQISKWRKKYQTVEQAVRDRADVP